MLRKIIIVLFLVGICMKCQSHPHEGNRRAIYKRTELPPETTPTATTPLAFTTPLATTTTTPPASTTPLAPTTPLAERTPIPKRKPEIGAYPVSSLGALSAPELQWHAAIYEKTTTPYRQICGGTIVKRDFVISAAHCFWSDDIGAHRAAFYAVAAGKLLRPWDAASDQYAQQSDIKSIHIPARFRGGATNFQADIAVLRLSSALEYAPGVQPACVSFDPGLEQLVLRKDNAGTITGFGLIEENGGPSPRLTYLELPYIEIEECFSRVEPGFVKYLTSDKMCAGYWDEGKALCRGDSGGGLIYTTEIQDSWRTGPYLLGVASTAQSDNNKCNAYTPASFTNIISHRNFLEQLIPGLEDECRYVYIGLAKAGMNQTEVRGKRKPLVSNNTATVSTSAAPPPTPPPSRAAPAPLPSVPLPSAPLPSAPLPSAPLPAALEPPALEWYAAIYNKSTAPYSQICGASVVKMDVVISAAHCFWSGDGLLDASLFKVGAGKLLQSWTAFEDKRLQQESDVTSIHIPPRYEDVASNYQGDIAVVRLRSPLEYSAAIRPVCISFDPELDKTAFCKNCLFLVTGWASSKKTDVPVPASRLRYVTVPLKDTDKCRNDVDPEFRKYVARDKVCAGFMGTALALCNGDVGGGLIRYSNTSSVSVPFLHGVASTMERHGKKCDVPVLTPASFTRVLYHRDFLEEHVPGLEDECRYVYFGERRPENVQIDKNTDQSKEANGLDSKDLMQNATRNSVLTTHPNQVLPSVQTAPDVQATDGNTKSTDVLLTVNNGTLRITVTAVKSIVLELQP